MKNKTAESLFSIFNRFKEAQYRGVSGVMCIESGKPGPVLGITACTHGNEPVGLAVFEYLLNELHIEQTLISGTLYLVINNYKATEKFFRSSSEDQIRKSRYCDINMNRLPRNALVLTDDKCHEIQRVQELYPIWQCFTYGLDIHSTTALMDPMIISRGGVFHSKLMRGFPIEVLVSNIDRKQIGIPAFAFYGGLDKDIPVFAIEAGQNAEPATFERAIRCTKALLQNLKMLHGVPDTGINIKEYREYHIDGALLFPDVSFDLIKSYRSYDSIRKGEVLARNAEREEIRAPFDGHLIMPTSRRGSEKDISEEVAFISRPVKIRRV